MKNIIKLIRAIDGLKASNARLTDNCNAIKRTISNNNKIIDLLTGVINRKSHNRGNTFTQTVDQKQLSKAVRAMYLNKHGEYKLTINQICNHFNISKPSLYRGYYEVYGK